VEAHRTKLLTAPGKMSRHVQRGDICPGVLCNEEVNDEKMFTW